MTMTYMKINTIWKRDGDGKIIDGDLSKEEFGNIKMWHITEKVDGTNIRVSCKVSELGAVRIYGKTDNAQIPTHLFNALSGIFTLPNFVRVFDNGDASKFPKEIVLFGE